MSFTVKLDLSPFVRGPYTGTGLVAFHTAQAVEALQKARPSSDFTVNFVSREKAQMLRDFKIEKSGLLGRLFGSRREVYHCFEMKLPQALFSHRVLTIHDLWTLDKNPYQSADFQKKQSSKILRAIDRADWIVTATRSVQDQLLKRFPEFNNRSSTIHWAPTELLGGEDAAVEPAVAEIVEAALKTPFVLMVATLESRKNHALFCRALKKIPDLKVVLLGGRGFGAEQALEAMATLPNEVVHFEKLSTNSLAALYRAALVTVLPSFDEGFGLPALEAMKHRSPVILSSIAPFREIAGSAALFVDPFGDGEDLAAHIKNIREVSEFRQEYVERGLAQVANYSWERVGREHLALYSKIGLGL